MKVIGLHLKRSGLCNRLRTIAGALTAGQILQVPVAVVWVPTITCPGKFTDLFVVPDGLMFDHRPRPTDSRLLVGGKWHDETVAGSFYQYVKDTMSSDEFHVAWHKIARNLVAVPAINLKVLTFSAAHSSESQPLVGVHVRRTDLVVDLAKKSIEITDTAMFARLDELIRETDCRLFLAADSEAARAPYLERYGDRIIFRSVAMNPGSCDPRARHTTLSDAAVDLLLLASCSRIVGTYGSSFSTFAGIIGDIPVERLGDK